MGLYYNFFQPVMRLTEKTSLPDPHSGKRRVKRSYDGAQTPLDRLCATDALDPVPLPSLRALRDALNPRQLRDQIYTLLEQLFALPCAAPDGSAQDVYLALFNLPYSLKGVDCPSVTLSIERTISVR